MNKPSTAERLRHHARTLRTNSLPLDALIPLLNQAADELDKPTEAEAAAPAQQAGQAPAPAPDLHHPDTPHKAEFDALYQTLCVRSITVHEIARRCWKAGIAAGSASPAVAPVAWTDEELVQVVEAVRAPLWKREAVNALRTALANASKPPVHHTENGNG